MEQKFSSANTSINSKRLPKAFTVIKWERGTTNLDLGGGKFDNATEYLKSINISNLIIDPYNRSKDWNEHLLNYISKVGGTDTATVLNVLNVIRERECRINLIQQAYSLIKENGTCYFQIYEGNGSGIGRETMPNCWQNNFKTNFYIQEIETCFEIEKIKGNIIVAKKKGSLK